MRNFGSVILKEILVVKRAGYEAFYPIIYLFIIMMFFNISLSYVGAETIKSLIPQMIWISCLLISVLNIENIFKDDYDDGTLEIILMNNKNLQINILAKVFSHWIISNAPIVIFAPLISLVLGISLENTVVLFLSLLIGTPTLSLIGSIVAALTVSLKRNKIITSIIVFPLYVPILIFGASAINNSYFSLSYNSEFLLMGILFLIFLLISPIVSAKALMISID